MKVLVLWNKISSSNLKMASYEPVVGENSSLQVETIYSQEAWEGFDLNAYYPNHILVLVELNWNNRNFEGYEIALGILKEWNMDRAPIIQFFSFLSREQLYVLTIGRGVYRVFVKSFKHIGLPEEIKLPEESYSLVRWNYLKKYTLTESGILDKLHHDIRNYLNNPKRISENIVSLFIRQVEGISDIIGKEVSDYLTSPSSLETEPEHILSKLDTLIGKRMVQLSEIYEGETSLYLGRSRYKLLLVEDNMKMLAHLKQMFESYFEVSDFSNGQEALTELKIGGLFYHAICIDLELLDETYRFDQEVQGIDILEYTSKNLPHIVRRVITGIGRKGVKELLPEMETQDIMLKSHLELFGRDETFVEFIEKLKSDVKKQSVFLEMKGPDDTLWADFSRQGGKEGGKFKRFYYELKLNESLFSEVWAEVASVVGKMLKNEDIIVPCSFEKTVNAKKLLNEFTYEKRITFLKQLLIHRLYWISKFRNDQFIIFKDEEDKENSFYHLPFWDGNLLNNPKQYFPYLGFGYSYLDPRSPVKESYRITFKFNFKKLFPEEIEYLKSADKLFSNSGYDFYRQNERFCEYLDKILFYIIEDQKNNPSKTQFKNIYSRFDNTFQITKEYSEKMLKLITNESKPNNSNNTRDTVYNLISEFAFVDDESDDDCTPELNFLPSSLNKIVVKLIDKFY